MEHLPDAAAHVALQAASLADTEPIMQPAAAAAAGRESETVSES